MVGGFIYKWSPPGRHPMGLSICYRSGNVVNVVVVQLDSPWVLRVAVVILALVVNGIVLNAIFGFIFR